MRGRRDLGPPRRGGVDFELLCLGPRELDAFLAGYGEHDAALRDRVAPLELVPLAAWTYQLAATRPSYP